MGHPAQSDRLWPKPRDWRLDKCKVQPGDPALNANCTQQLWFQVHTFTHSHRCSTSFVCFLTNTRAHNYTGSRVSQRIVNLTARRCRHEAIRDNFTVVTAYTISSKRENAQTGRVVKRRVCLTNATLDKPERQVASTQELVKSASLSRAKPNLDDLNSPLAAKGHQGSCRHKNCI